MDRIRGHVKYAPRPAPVVIEKPTPARRFRPWTDAELAYVLKHFGRGASIEEIAAHLKRSPTAVENRARILRLID